MQINPNIQEKTINGVSCLHFTFRDKLTEKDAVGAIEIWKDFLNTHSCKCTHVWNCLQMTGYEPMARSNWQKAMKEFKAKIGDIWLISDSNIIRTGARLLSLFTSLDIRAIKSENDIFNRTEKLVWFAGCGLTVYRQNMPMLRKGWGIRFSRMISQFI